MDIVTYETLYKVLKKLLSKRGLSDDDIKQLAEYIVNFFGYNDRIVDNVLTPADREVFYTLEEIGILKTYEEEITVSKSKLWRVHYWIYRMNNIKKILKEEEEEETSPEDIYKKFFER